MLEALFRNRREFQMKPSRRRSAYIGGVVWLVLLTILGCANRPEESLTETSHTPTFSVNEEKHAHFNPGDPIAGGRWEGITTAGSLWKRVSFEVDSENRCVEKIGCEWRSLSQRADTYKGTATWPAEDVALPVPIQPDGSFEFQAVGGVFKGRFASPTYGFGTAPALGVLPVGVDPEDDCAEWRAAPVK